MAFGGEAQEEVNDGLMQSQGVELTAPIFGNSGFTLSF